MTGLARAGLAGLVMSAALAWPAPARAQASCRQVLATATVSSGSYAVVAAQPFDGRVFVYAPGGSPEVVWVVEGVYGRPFVRPSGSLSASQFSSLRANNNIRATAIRVVKGDGSEGATVRVGKDAYRVQVAGVSGGRARVQACTQ